MANWDWARNTMMPNIGSKRSVITNTFAQHLARKARGVNTTVANRYGGVDLSYPRPYPDAPPIFTPIAGKILKAGTDAWHSVILEDSEGNRHGFLHMVRVTVRVGDVVKAGQQVGNEGGWGKSGNNTYGKHLHYQIDDKKTGLRLDPVAWWNGIRDPGEIDPNPDSTELPGEELPDTSSPPAPPVGTIDEYKPKPAAASQVSLTSLAIWTNRVPMHEPWPRVLLVDATTNGPTESYQYNVNHKLQIEDDGTEDTSGQIGRLEGDEIIQRNEFWRR